MFMVILASSSVAVLVIIITLISYLITVIWDESDDAGSADALSLDTQDFTSTPVVSPVNLSASHSAGSLRWRKYDRAKSRLSTSEFRAHNDVMSDADIINSLDSQSLQSSEIELSSYPDGEPLVGQNLECPDPIPESKTDVGFKWDKNLNEQKSLLNNSLGVSATKQLVNEFDQCDIVLGGNPLHWCNSRKSLEKLINLGISPENLNTRGETALHISVRKRKLQVLVGLLCHGVNIECRNHNGETPLITASKANDIFAIQLLLVFEADIDARDNMGHSARHYASSICNRHKGKSVLPSAAHLILAMLNEMNAKRCPEPEGQDLKSDKDQTIKQDTDVTKASLEVCSEGCSPLGCYNGNSYNRWQNFSKESLYKRSIFNDIIQEIKRNLNDRSRSDPKSGSSTRKPSRLLCIDGGGMRGVIVCQIMIELQKYLKKPLISYFDWIGGTSVGAFLSCAMCLGKTLNQLRGICFDVKDEVFSGHKPYNSKAIEKVLKKTYGKARMSDIKNKNLAVTTVIADRDPIQLRFFRNYKSASQLLEQYGFPADRYNNLSASSQVAKRPLAGQKKTDQTVKSSGSSRLSSSNESSQVGLEYPKKPVDETRATKSTTRESQTEIVDIKCTSKSTLDSYKLGKTTQHDAPVIEEQKVVVKSPAKETSHEDKTSSDSVIDENDRDPLIWQAVRASTAAPFFFKPYGPYLDGGIISNNPTVDMLSEYFTQKSAKKFLRSRIRRDNTSETRITSPNSKLMDLDTDSTGELKLVLSLGTGRGKVIGRQAIVDFGQVAAGFSTVFSPVDLVRSIRAARSLFRKLMQQSCHTEDHILDRAQSWCGSLKIPYYRINPPLTSLFSIDDKRDEQLINALWQTKLYMRSMSDQLKELGDLLDSCP